jgi:hypothetical protein
MKQQCNGADTTIIDEMETDDLAVRIDAFEKYIVRLSHVIAPTALPIVHQLLLDERDRDAARVDDRELRRAPRRFAEHAVGMNDPRGA